MFFIPTPNLICLSKPFARFCSLLITLLFVVLGLSFATVAYGQEKLKLSHGMSEGGLLEQAVLPFLDQKIQTASQELIALEAVRDQRPETLLRRLKDGTIDMAWGSLSDTLEELPRTSVFALPFMGETAAVSANERLQRVRALIETDFEGVNLLLLQAGNGKTLFSNLRPLHSRGAGVGQILATTNFMQDEIGKAIGARHKPFAHFEDEKLPQDFESGVVTALIGTSLEVDESDLNDAVYFATNGLNLGRDVYWLAISDKALDRFDTEVKTALLTAFSPQDMAALSAVIERAEEKAKAELETAGVLFSDLVADRAIELQAAITPVISQWQQDAARVGIDGSELLVKVRD